MIQLHSDCLVFETSNGQKIPCSAELVAIELMGDTANAVDPTLIQHASEAVLHYFQHENRKGSVSIHEFTEALAQVLRGLGVKVTIPEDPQIKPSKITEADLTEMIEDQDDCLELSFYPRLRDAVKRGLEDSPDVLRFKGLKPCIKRLAGAKRWCPKCEKVRERVVHYLRNCWSNEKNAASAALMVN